MSARAIAAPATRRISLFYFANWYTAASEIMDHTAPASDTPLGVPGYTFADLHKPERLASLDDRFNEEVQAADEALWREWAAYREAPDAPRSPIALSNLLIAMAAHVSRFVTRLFDVSSAASAVATATRAEDDLFRFKVDFVRRRALPLLKGAAHLVSTPDDDAVVRGLIGGVPARDTELAVARAGCALLDREKRDKESVAPELEALKRWCAARIHDPAYRGWVIFRFPENVEPWNLVNVQRPVPDLPEIMLGPDERLRRRDGSACRCLRPQRACWRRRGQSLRRSRHTTRAAKATRFEDSLRTSREHRTQISRRE